MGEAQQNNNNRDGDEEYCEKDVEQVAYHLLEFASCILLVLLHWFIFVLLINSLTIIADFSSKGQSLVLFFLFEVVDH